MKGSLSDGGGLPFYGHRSPRGGPFVAFAAIGVAAAILALAVPDVGNGADGLRIRTHLEGNIIEVHIGRSSIVHELGSQRKGKFARNPHTTPIRQLPAQQIPNGYETRLCQGSVGQLWCAGQQRISSRPLPLDSSTVPRRCDRGPRLRNQAAIANHNTLLYVLIDLRALRRIRETQAAQPLRSGTDRSGDGGRSPNHSGRCRVARAAIGSAWAILVHPRGGLDTCGILCELL